MRWGRRKQDTPNDNGERDVHVTSLPPLARTVLVCGALLCTLFFAFAVSDRENAELSYPANQSAMARAALRREHTALTAVLGIDLYFPEEAVYAGAFGREHKEWSFTEYLQDALRTVLIEGIR